MLPTERQGVGHLLLVLILKKNATHNDKCLRSSRILTRPTLALLAPFPILCLDAKMVELAVVTTSCGVWVSPGL